MGQRCLDKNADNFVNENWPTLPGQKCRQNYQWKLTNFPWTKMQTILSMKISQLPLDKNADYFINENWPTCPGQKCRHILSMKIGQLPLDKNADNFVNEKWPTSPGQKCRQFCQWKLVSLMLHRNLSLSAWLMRIAIGVDNGLSPNWQQTTIWTNDDPFQKCIWHWGESWREKYYKYSYIQIVKFKRILKKGSLKYQFTSKVKRQVMMHST